jgi:branched-chain amino acid transport system substrate-binding protein
LIEELWGRSPPADASTALQAHVSRLRKLLEPEHGGNPQLLVTRPEGYALRIEAEQLDLNLFEASVRDARGALERGEAEAASRTLREALALWRGTPLAGLEYETFAAEAVRRLEELRLDAVEARVEADLALGRHAELAAELDALVRDHPLRERLRGQLMLALYRSGRQADALAVYDEGRRQLSEQLGIEPGAQLQRLQAQVLAHDRALEPPTAARAPREPAHRAPPRRRRSVILAAAASVAGAVALVVLSDDGGERVTGPSAGTLYALAAETGEPEGEQIEISALPAAVSADAANVWTLDADSQTISRVDVGTGEVSTFGVGATPIALESGEALWVELGGRIRGAQTAGPVGTALARVDPTTSTVRARVTLPRRGPASAIQSADQLAVEADAVWTIGPDQSVSRIDPRTDRVTGTVGGLEAVAIATGDVGTWVLASDGTIARISARGDRFVDRARVGASAVASIAVGNGSVWVSAPGDGTVWRVDPAARPAMRTIEVGTGATALAFGGDALWVANPLRGTVSRVDPEENAVTATAQLGGSPRDVAVAGDTVWAVVAPGGEVPLPPETGSPGSRVHASCGPTFFGGEGEPDALIVSDLPLQGGVRISAQQMVQAIALVVRSRAFRAGELTVGYQSCDDSVARTGLFDESKCAANASAYLGDERVLGVVGTLNSPCSVAALPVLNGGPEPAPAMVSPLNSYIGLTRPAPGAPPNELEKLYPEGERNFVRVYPADDHQASALADLAQGIGADRVVALDDGDLLYGGALANRFARDARERGLEVAGRLQWDPRAQSYGGLAADVAAMRPDAVYLGGTLSTNGAAVLRALRARLGSRVTFLLAEGFTPTGFLVEQAGDAADGAYLSVVGLLTEDFPAEGQRFASELRETLPGVPIEPSAIYAAAATEVLLGAIASSDGTRPSVVDRLFATQVEDSVIGPVRFDRHGDLVSPPVTILRIEPGARELPSFPDALPDAVVRP